MDVASTTMPRPSAGIVPDDAGLDALLLDLQVLSALLFDPPGSHAQHDRAA